MTRRHSLRAAFTLIELLIAVAIVAILAALAIVNMSEAQTRSRVARAKADIRTIAGALEAYSADHNVYPHAAVADQLLDRPLDSLSTPLAYLTSVPEDVFGHAQLDIAPSIIMHGYNYKDAASTSVGMPGETYGVIWKELPDRKYMLHSCGPNQRWDVTPYVEYDPTNGSRSHGDICVFGPIR